MLIPSPARCWSGYGSLEPNRPGSGGDSSEIPFVTLLSLLESAPNCSLLSPKDLQAGFLNILPAIETHAQICFRYLRCPGKKDDAIQETIAVAWKAYVAATRKGK